MKEFKVTFRACTERAYNVSAEDEDEAKRVALAQLDNDWEADPEWRSNAETVAVDYQGDSIEDED